MENTCATDVMQPAGVYSFEKNCQQNCKQLFCTLNCNQYFAFKRIFSSVLRNLLVVFTNKLYLGISVSEVMARSVHMKGNAPTHTL